MRKLIISLAFCSAVPASAQQFFDVYFEFDKSALNATAKASLDSFTRIAGNAAVYLFGHCDSIGSIAYNDRLAGARLRSVSDYLVGHGIQKERIREKRSFGERAPVNSNATEEERRLNRRVQVSFITADEPGKSVTQKIDEAATGDNIILRNINFYGGRNKFLPESEPALKELLEAMQSRPKMEIRIEGHICCQSGPADGLDIETNVRNLSVSRAQAIHDYLISNGIDARRVEYKGFGHTVPIHPYPELNEIQEMENRRVEIRILKK